jgi:hypothetical protein
LLVGLSVLAMCADLLHDRWKSAAEALKRKFGFRSAQTARRSSWLYDTS